MLKMNLIQYCQKCWGCLHIYKWKSTKNKNKKPIFSSLSRKTVKATVFIQHRSEALRAPVHTKFHRYWHFLLKWPHTYYVLWIILDDFITYHNVIGILFYLVIVPSMYVWYRYIFFLIIFGPWVVDSSMQNPWIGSEVSIYLWFTPFFPIW